MRDLCNVHKLYLYMFILYISMDAHAFFLHFMPISYRWWNTVVIYAEYNVQNPNKEPGCYKWPVVKVKHFVPMVSFRQSDCLA